jgi:acetylornithine deacetylase
MTPIDRPIQSPQEKALAMSPDDTALYALLADLVRTDSVNPGLDPAGAGERHIADLVERWARQHDLAVRRVGDPGRPSLIITTTRTAAGPALLLCGHLDTVGHGTMTDPTEPTVRGRRMYGRGTYDMKAGLAAALVAAARLNRPDHAGSVTVAAAADEEHLSAGTTEVLRHITADAAIVTEPTELSVATAHRGFIWIQIDIHGVAAHGSRPHLGIDAIAAAGPILTGLTKLQHQLDQTHHPRVGPGIVHASLIKGGPEESTIPEHCTLVIERRTIPGESTSTVLTEIDELLEPARQMTPGATFTTTVTLERHPMQTPDDAPVVRAALAAQNHILGRTDGPVGASYWADSALISAAGIPTLLLGPAGDGAHAETEWVDLNTVSATARILQETAQRLRSES